MAGKLASVGRSNGNFVEANQETSHIWGVDRFGLVSLTLSGGGGQEAFTLAAVGGGRERYCAAVL